VTDEAFSLAGSCPAELLPLASISCRHFSPKLSGDGDNVDEWRAATHGSGIAADLASIVPTCKACIWPPLDT
jgi:hypothetical protein